VAAGIGFPMAAAYLYEIPMPIGTRIVSNTYATNATSWTLGAVPNFDPAQRIDMQADATLQTGSANAGGMRMLDVIMLAIGLGFFTLSVGYTIACDRL
jgi:hypothetical protein